MMSGPKPKIGIFFNIADYLVSITNAFINP